MKYLLLIKNNFGVIIKRFVVENFWKNLGLWTNSSYLQYWSNLQIIQVFVLHSELGFKEEYEKILIDLCIVDYRYSFYVCSSRMFH